MFKPYGVPVERLFDGEPIIRPSEEWWESGVTFNSGAYYLERTDQNDQILNNLLPSHDLTDPLLANGVVALFYRARPAEDPGYKWSRSFTGLALFTPELKLLERFADPIMVPGIKPINSDYLGIEDPRITRIGNQFYAVYCGTTLDESSKYGHKGRNCMARSSDLIHWEKYGALRGDVNENQQQGWCPVS